MIIKVCGIKYQDNLDKIIDANIDMLGFNFYKPSTRYISQALDTSSLPATKLKVGVFVNESFQEIGNKIKEYNLDYVQLHGNETPDLCTMLSRKIKVIKVFSIGNPLDFKQTDAYENCSLFLFDTKTVKRGGSGKKFNWKLLEEYSGHTQFLLAGGIGPEDHSVIKKICHPKFAGIDINSCFEIRPGEKNIEKVKSFARKCKN